jgi:hypothetical protein
MELRPVGGDDVLGPGLGIDPKIEESLELVLVALDARFGLEDVGLAPGYGGLGVQDLDRGLGADLDLTLGLGQEVAAALEGLLERLEVLDGVDEVPIGRFHVVDGLDEDRLELAPRNLEVILGDDDLASADGPAEILEEGLGQDEVQAACVGGVVALEELIVLGVIVTQGGLEGAPHGDPLEDRGLHARRPVDVGAGALEGPRR